MNLTVEVWQNESFSLFNMTAVNTSLASTPLLAAGMDKVVNIFLLILVGITMVSLGCTMEVAKIKAHIKKPKGVVIGVLAQYVVMPLSSFCLAKVFQLTDIKAVVVLISGCCPGGILSNFLTLTLKGDMNLSIVMTTCSMTLSLGMMPLLLYIYCQGFSNVQRSVPFTNILLSLVTILVPSIIGILLNHYRPQFAKTFRKVGLPLMIICIVVVGTLLSIGMGRSILLVLSPPLMAIGALMPFVGLSCGYVIAALCKLNHSERRTIAVETGCQNMQLCLIILKLAFPPEIIGSLFLFPSIYIAFQLMEMAMIIALFWGHQRFILKKKEARKESISVKNTEISSEDVI